MQDRDTQTNILNNPPSQLAGLFALATNRATTWRAEELGAMLAHVLAAPIETALGDLDPNWKAQFLKATTSDEARPKTFGELIKTPHPPLKLLQAAKDLTKSAGQHLESDIPPKVVLALYYAVIAAALVNGKARITKLSDAELRHGFSWTAALEWINPQIKSLVLEAQKTLSAES